MYKSPIDVICSDIQMKLEDKVFKAVQHVGINVDKDELIQALSYDRQQYTIGYADGYADAQAEQRWIPVKERVPENACQCIVTAKVKHVDNYPDYEVDTADFADGVFTTANSWWGVESIIAWMPLPEPWKGEE